MHESKDVNCPNCGERVTIHFSDQTCSECGADIQELQKAKAQRVRKVKEQVRQVLVNSQFTLTNIKKQRDVIRADIQSSFPLAVDESRLTDPEYDIETAMDRQQELSDVIRDVKKVDGVSDAEKWVGGDANQVTGSKYGMKPDLTYKTNKEAVLLIGTNV